MKLPKIKLREIRLPKLPLGRIFRVVWVILIFTLWMLAARLLILAAAVIYVPPLQNLIQGGLDAFYYKATPTMALCSIAIPFAAAAMLLQALRGAVLLLADTLSRRPTWEIKARSARVLVEVGFYALLNPALQLLMDFLCQLAEDDLLFLDFTMVACGAGTFALSILLAFLAKRPDKHIIILGQEADEDDSPGDGDEPAENAVPEDPADSPGEESEDSAE